MDLNNFDNYWDKTFNISPEQIISKFEKNKWLLERIFWSNTQTLYKDEYEYLKFRLKQKWYINVDDYFPPLLDYDKTQAYLEILFKVPQLQQETQEEKSKFLWLF